VTAERVDPPSATLTGSADVTVGSNVTFDVSASASEASLGRVTWLVNHSQVGRSSLSGKDDDATLEHQFNESGSYTVTARVVSRLGRAVTETVVVDVTPESRLLGLVGRAGDSVGFTGGFGGGDSGSGNSLEKEYYTNGEYVFLNDMDSDDQVTYRGITYDVSPENTSYYYPDEVENLGGSGRSELRRISIEQAQADKFNKKFDDTTDWEEVTDTEEVEAEPFNKNDNTEETDSTDSTDGTVETPSDSSKKWNRGTGPPLINDNSGSKDNSLRDNSDNSDSSGWTPGTGPPPGRF
jgi:hypothetical protein